MKKGTKRNLIYAVTLIIIVLICAVCFIYRTNMTRVDKSVFESQITQLNNYRENAVNVNMELCYEGIVLSSKDFYKKYVSYDERAYQRMIDKVAGFINGLGFELADFSVELYLKAEDESYVECITYYKNSWYCIEMDMESGSVDINSYSELETDSINQCIVYKLVSDKREKVLFQLIE